ncbi:DNA repair protein RecO [Membranihabitans maritimus]|uniref:DNA repair protein RecO n=1 Tax=Membranihabitans maritimus TaxID=2904244 RepID=UPI001F004F78
MPRISKSEGIVIRRINYRESSMIVDILTRDHGLVGFIISGVRKKSAKTSPGIFTPGYILDLVYYENDPNKLWRIKEAGLAIHLKNTPYDILRGNTALCICELLKKVLHSYDPSEELFLFTERYILILDEIEKPGNVFLHFLVGLSVYLGFGPEERSLAGIDSYFDLKSGNFTKTDPAHPLTMEGRMCELLGALLGCEKEYMESIKMTRAERHQLTGHLIDFIRYHTHAFENLRSYDVLKTLW